VGKVLDFPFFEMMTFSLGTHPDITLDPEYKIKANLLAKLHISPVAKATVCYNHPPSILR
jgi:hypothetical protein